jgi:hypothetical protein
MKFCPHCKKEINYLEIIHGVLYLNGSMHIDESVCPFCGERLSINELINEDQKN